MNNTDKKIKSRRPLSRQRIVKTALKIADQEGVAGLSMRRLASKLKVEAMSLYYHFKNKDEILDELVDLIFAEIDWSPTPDTPWQEAMNQRAHAVRAILLKHTWAIGMLESRKNPGPATLRHHDAVLGCLLQADFSPVLVAHSYAVLDSFIYGFVQQELAIPAQSDDELQEMATSMAQSMPTTTFPHLQTMTAQHYSKPDYSFAAEFDFGLELIIAGLMQHKKSKLNEV